MCICPMHILTSCVWACLCEAGAALCARGAEAIVLGGTDLFLAYDENPGYPVFDAADAHIDAIYRAALG